MGKPRKFSSEFKAQVMLAVVSGHKSLAEDQPVKIDDTPENVAKALFGIKPDQGKDEKQTTAEQDED